LSTNHESESDFIAFMRDAKKLKTEDRKMWNQKMQDHGCYAGHVVYYAAFCFSLASHFNFHDYQHGIFLNILLLVS